MKLSIKAVPGSARNGIAGWLGDVLKVRVNAPAEDGKANAAIVAVIAEQIGVSIDCVRIVAGGSSPRKIVEITGLSESEVLARLPDRAARA
jgi:uncharacterized protein (TIGR00251 family)